MRTHSVFAIGVEPATAWLRDCGIALDSEGFVRTGTDEHAPRPLPLESSIPGVFAVGDVPSSSAKRVARRSAKAPLWWHSPMPCWRTPRR
jgi:thioredoxin reductase (NADPH)